MATWTDDAPEPEGDAKASPDAQDSSAPDLSKFVPIERFAGLQRHSQKLQTELTNLKARMTDTTQDYEGRLNALTAEREQTLSQFQQAQKALQEREQALTQYAHREKVGSVIAEKYPVLTDLHNRRLLRTDGLDGEELDKFLNEYAATLEAMGTQQRRQVGLGATPPPPAAAPASKTSDELYQDLMKMSPSSDEYKTKWAQYEEALRADSKLTVIAG